MTLDPDINEIQVGPYTGVLAEAFRVREMTDQLARLPDLLAEAARLQAGGRHTLSRITLNVNNTRVDLAVKAFGSQRAAKDWMDRSRGSKARRSWLAARALQRHGVGTPEPFAYLDRWQGRQLAESYYLCAHVSTVTNFRDELYRLYRHDPDCDKLMRLLQRVASAIADLHDAGVQHNDLGNQNILLRRVDGDDWNSIQFIDLNRAALREELTDRERARDISRIDLPSDFLRVFKVMYFRDRMPPPEFERWEQRYRRTFDFHTLTRRYRHPIREYWIRKQQDPETVRPPDPDIWIWDPRSVQAIATMGSRDRHRHYPISNAVSIAGSLIRHAPSVWRHYRVFQHACFREPVSLAGRIGLAVEPRAPNVEKELEWLAPLGHIPLLLRFYRHEFPKQWDTDIELVHRLHKMGHPVSIALVQDRKAVKDRALWTSFARQVVEGVREVVDWVEVGHAINRVKWGIWSFDEYARLAQCIGDLRRANPRLKLMGPAVIDFEYPFLLGALDRLPHGFQFQALSHHLYVDRRGAPENPQGSFATREKIALARAIAAASGRCGDKLILSEVNWPLMGTGVYSPVCSPYETPGPRSNDPSVSEEDYADYMLRYLLIAVCSGQVECAYWWRLAARGFGLVDDTTAVWRARPAYDCLKHFLNLLGASRFVERRTLPEGAEIYFFETAEGHRHAIAYAPRGSIAVRSPFHFEFVTDAAGQRLSDFSDTLTLTGRPVYLMDADRPAFA